MNMDVSTLTLFSLCVFERGRVVIYYYHYLDSYVIKQSLSLSLCVWEKWLTKVKGSRNRRGWLGCDHLALLYSTHMNECSSIKDSEWQWNQIIEENKDNFMMWSSHQDLLHPSFFHQQREEKKHWGFSNSF